MKKRILSLILTTLMAVGAFSTFTVNAADDTAKDVTKVSSMAEFTEVMKSSGTATIQLTRSIYCTHKKGSEGHTAIVVNGNKTIDLNGYELGCTDESNVKEYDTSFNWDLGDHWGTDCNQSAGGKKTFMKVSSGASLTVDDTSGYPGMVYFRGKLVKLCTGYYNCRPHFNAYTTRDVFEVNGTLTVNNGQIVAGNEESSWITDGVEAESYESAFGVHFNGDATEQIHGSAVVVNGGGKLIVNGGSFTGRGVEISLKPGLVKPGSLTEIETWYGAVEDEVKNLIGSGDAETEGNVIIRARDEVVNLNGGSAEINGGIFIGHNGANVFGGTTDGKLKISAGMFHLTTDEHIRMIDIEYHEGKFYAMGTNGTKGAVGFDSKDLADINVSYITYDGLTCDTPEEIKAKDFSKATNSIAVGKKKDPTVEVTLTAVNPERQSTDDGKTFNKQGYYPAYINEKLEFSFDALPLTADQKASGYTLTKSYRISNEDPNAASTNVSNRTTADGPFEFSHTFPKKGWYKVAIGATVKNKEGKQVGHAGYTYYFYAFAKLESLTVSKMPAKTVYNAGEKIDTTGIALQMKYSDGTTQDVTSFTDQWKVVQEEPVKKGQTSYAIEYTSTITDDIKETVSVNVPITIALPVKITVTGGYAEAGGETKVTEISVGTKVKLVPDAAPEGKEFAGWTYENDIYAPMTKDGDFYTFTMPEKEVRVKAVYKNKTTATEATPEKTKNYPPEITIENKFTDVPDGEWYHDYVLIAVQIGLVNGKSETEYKPIDNLTYAEAVKLAACMHQLYTTGKITLQGGNPWYQTYVDYCKENGIISKDYNYAENATRAGYMEIFANALPAEALEAINNIADNSIPDVPMTAPYADAVYKLYRAGILTGSDEAHSCKPNDNIKRGEVAAILIRMMYDGERKSFSMGEEAAKPLAIKKQPGTLIAVPGTAAVFTVEVEGGKAPYAYQWKIYGGGARKPQINIDGETSASIVRIAPEANAYTSCWCVITDAEGNTVKSEYAVVVGKTKNDADQIIGSAEPTNEEFLMYVEDVFSVTNKGTVATGYIVRGKLNKGDSIKIISSDGTEKTATVAGIEMFNKSLDSAEKGDNIGLLFSSEIDKTMVARGDSIVSSKTNYKATNKLIGTLKLLTKDEGGRTNAISDGYSLQFKRNGHDFTGKITGIGTMNPGETKENVIVTFTSFNGIFYVGQEITVMEGGRTLGTFTVTEK